MSFLMALIVSFIGALPLLFSQKKWTFGLFATVSTIILWPSFYFGLPHTIAPFLGALGGAVLVEWFIAAIITSLMNEAVSWTLGLPILFLLVFIGKGCESGAAVRHAEYATLLEKNAKNMEVTKREWTVDQQPKDPSHVRYVAPEFAMYRARKQLGNAQKEGAIGSQFYLVDSLMTAQRINGELWYLIPLDFVGWKVWTTTKDTGAPGFVKVHGEDPDGPISIVADRHYIYTPGAYFSRDLHRHLWNKGYRTKGLTAMKFEQDENGKEWFVTSTYRLSLGWNGEILTGVVIVDPTTGEDHWFPLDQIPDWVDLFVPGHFLEEWINMKGKYSGGWINSWWGKKNLFESEHASLNFGANGDLLWTAIVTSVNSKDDSMIGLYYMDSRTRECNFYHAAGATEEAVLKVVDSFVKFDNFYGTGPVIFNVYGTMASIVPLLAKDSHNFMGVAIVKIDDQKVVWGKSIYEAYRKYRNILTTADGMEIPENEVGRETITGIVTRTGVYQDTYYFRIDNHPFIFVASIELSPELVTMKEGDNVKVTFIPSQEDKTPVTSFDDLDQLTIPTFKQTEARERAKGYEEEGRMDRSADAIRERIKNMSNEDVLKLGK
jgi:hypothetical protein